MGSRDAPLLFITLDNNEMFTSLTPCIPLSLKRRGGKKFIERGFHPLSYFTPPSLAKGRG
jgi:hypothetical protein